MPKDRFLKGKRLVDRRSAVAARQVAEDRRREKHTAETDTFICKQCQRWYPLSEFEYVYKDDTMIATRCSACRSQQRRKYSRQERRTGGGPR